MPIETHKLVARVEGASPQWSNEVPVQIGSLPLAIEAKRRDAARLMLQASFGPRSVADIDEAANRTFAVWLDAQFAMPWNTHAGWPMRRPLTLVERINLVLFAGGISATTQTILEKAINAYPTNERNNRLQAALNLAMIAPEFVLQR